MEGVYYYRFSSLKFLFPLFQLQIKNQTSCKYSKTHTKYTVKPVLSDHSKIEKIKVLMVNCSLMKVESIAECSLGAFCNTFDLH